MTSSKNALPPMLGKIGSILFFVILFSLAKENSEGYQEFRKCHGNCINGLLHFVGMPPAVSGVFLVVRGVADSPIFTRILQSGVTTCYLCYYLTYETNVISPWLFYGLYMTIWECLYHFVYNKNFTRSQFVFYGILLILVNVGGLETIGHGVFEHHHRYVEELVGRKKRQQPISGFGVWNGYDSPQHSIFPATQAMYQNSSTASFIHPSMV